jgi:rubrerythrin
MSEKIQEWKCSECGYLFDGAAPPDACPECDCADTWEGSEAIREWKCGMCDFLFNGTNAPEVCPSCSCETTWESV